jgi:tRNA dimethylallyltransferase
MAMSRPTLVVIGGPTASGKTHAAASVAKRLGTEVISADSRQFYHALRIGTARPRPEELLGVPHHFLGHLDLAETWSAGAFARAAEPVLQRVTRDRGSAVLVGGSGLYIDALLFGLDPMPPADMHVRSTLLERLRTEGMASLSEELKQRDPLTWERIDRANPQRVVRALEVCLTSGRPYSAQRTTPREREDVRIVRIALDVPRAALYARIDARVDAMVHAGLVEEVRSLLPHREANALHTVGYTELFDHFDGRCTLEEAIERIKQHTRNYAKRQMTWLRRTDAWQWTAPDAVPERVMKALA